MRRTVAVVLTCVLATVGCQAQAPQPSAAPSGGSSAAPTAAPSTTGTGEKDVIVLKSGTGVVTGHPFFAMAEEYNRTHPNVEVRLDIAPWSAETWAGLSTGLAAGSPPDIMRVSIGGAAGAGALQSPLLVDVKPYLSEAEIADYGPDVLAPGDIDGKYVVWPQDRDWGTCIVANGEALAEAGIDVAKIQAEGWTFDQFREVAKKLTSGDRYGFGFSAGYATGAFLELVWRAGIPDGTANMGGYFWGNKFTMTGPDAVQAAGLLHDMIYVDKSVPKEVTGLQEHMPLLWSGKLAMINYYHGAVGEIRAYNASIDSGEVKGEKANFNVVLLPWPYDPDNGANVNIARTTGLAVFKQDPYRGDAHMENVIEFTRFLTSPINLAAFANWEGTIPAKTSAFGYSTQIKEPQIAWWADWATKHAVVTFPYGHPAYGAVDADGITPNLTALLNDEKTAEQAVADWTTAATAALEKWVAENPEAAKEWASPPPGYPENFMTPIAGN